MKRPFFAGTLLLAFWSPAAQAQETPPISRTQTQVSRTQTQAFALAYTLRTCDLRAQSFVVSVKALKNIDDDQAAGAEVSHLSRQAANLRRRQAASYTQIAWLLDQMNAPPSLRHWSAQTAASLAAPLVYSDDAQSLAKTEPDTAATLAELTEVQAVKTQANAHQPPLNAWLKLTGGRLSVWTAEVGSYAADLHWARHLAARDALSPGTARRLLQLAPAGASSEVRGDLSEMIPRGGGNLQSLATVAPANVTPQKVARVAEKLITAYSARPLTETANSGE